MGQIIVLILENLSSIYKTILFRYQVIEFRDLSLDERINIILKYKRDLDIEYIKNFYF